MPEHLQSIFAIVVFLITYALIMSEKIHRAVVALMSAVIVMLAGVITYEKAIHHIDWNTIGLLIGMMIIVGITRRSGVFEFTAIWSAKKAKGDPIQILIALAVITALASAFLDNVTTVLLIVPVTFSITDKLNVTPIPYLMTEIIASNIGGTATLIGDPPNIMISGPAGLSFMDFIINLAPVVIIIFVITIIILRFVFKNDLITTDELKQKMMEFDAFSQLKDINLMKKSLFVLAITILGFTMHSTLGVENSVIALAGATLLLLITKENPEEIFLTVEWTSIFFFAGLFVVVGSLVETGVIRKVAEEAIQLTGGNLTLTTFLILWMSAIASSIVDNIPFVATMIPLINDMGPDGMNAISNLSPIWWALSLGACLGGNGTIIGAAANVIVSGIAGKHGYHLSFIGYMKLAYPLMIMSVLISSVYIYVLYL